MDLPGLADLFNVPSEIEYKGKTYKIAKPTLLQRAQFSRWLEDRAVEGVTRNPNLSKPARQEYMQAISRDVAGGVYDFGGAVSLTALASPSGMAKVAHIVLRDHHPEVTEAFAGEMIEDQFERIAAAILGRVEADPAKKALLATLLGSSGPPSSSRTRPSAGRKKKSRR